VNNLDLSRSAVRTTLGSIKSLTEIPSKFTGIRNKRFKNIFLFDIKGAATKFDETPCMKIAEAYSHTGGSRTRSPEGLPM